MLSTAYFPGFQMFRFSYKWVAGVEFGISGLYGLASFAVLSWLREQLAARKASRREPFGWVPAAAGGLLVAMPIIIFIPVLVLKMNYPGTVIPAWEYRENALVGNDDRHRRCALPDAVSRTVRLGKSAVLHRELADRSSDDLRAAREASLQRGRTSGCAEPIVERAKVNHLRPTCFACLASTRSCSATISFR